MRGYRLEMLDEDRDQWGIVPIDDNDSQVGSGVVRSGIDDALFWIRTQEDMRR